MSVIINRPGKVTISRDAKTLMANEDLLYPLILTLNNFVTINDLGDIFLNNIGGTNDAYDVANWNLIVEGGTPFTNVVINLPIVTLYGGSNLAISSIIYSAALGIRHINDLGKCLVGIKQDAFYESELESLSSESITYLENNSLAADNLAVLNLPNLQNIYGPPWNSANFLPLTSISFPKLVSVPDYCFYYFTSLTSIYLPACTSLGSTSGFNNVFQGVTGKTISATFNTALATNNTGGTPDGDIQYLQTNNTMSPPIQYV